MKIFKLWSPVIIWCGFIFFLSSLPNLRVTYGVTDFILRKIAHMAEYFILTLLIYRAFKLSFGLSDFSLLFWPFTLSFLYAVSDELHQLFVWGRSSEAKDVLIDTMGIIIFYLLIKYNKRFSNKIMLWA